jgi:glucose-1-phosphate thymidylyltransferase
VTVKGILLAGGKGSRLSPLTTTVNKHLLPIFDKPMIYYSLTTLMFTGVKEILVVSSPRDIEPLKELLGDGSQWGLHFEYFTQYEPNGIAEVFRILPKNFRATNLVLMLGDNLLYGMGLGSSLKDLFLGENALAFTYEVSNPQEYGVVVFDEKNMPISLEEKPKIKISNFAIPGLYFFDETVCDRSLMLKKSDRGEFEITDLLNNYLGERKLKIKVLERGVAWLDTGNAANLLAASEFVRVIEQRQGLKIGCPEEVAFREGLISRGDLENLINLMPDNEYREYLLRIL